MLTEALISAVTEAVIDRVANIAGLEDRLRQWLRRDPARLAFAKAFTRARPSRRYSSHTTHSDNT